jgi:hypothetical protein
MHRFIGTNKIYIPAVLFLEAVMLNFRNRKINNFPRDISPRGMCFIFKNVSLRHSAREKQCTPDGRMSAYCMRGARTEKSALVISSSDEV